MKFRLTKNIYSEEMNDKTLGIYNPIKGHNFAFISKVLFSELQERGYTKGENKINLEKLIRKNFLVPLNFSEKNYFNSFKRKLRTDIHLMYLLLSQDCNLNCSYCFEELPKRKKGIMPSEVAEKAIDYFFDISNPERKIIFYGGEPTMNRVVLRNSIKKIRSYNKGRDTEIILITNGTLIDRKLAQFLGKEKVNVAVSIDGPEEIHNSLRKYIGGNGSYSKVIEGYNILKEEGVNPSISCTIDKHNLESLTQVAEFFVKELKPSGVGFNFLIASGKDEEFSGDYIEKASKGLLKAFRILKEGGIYEDRIMRRLEKIRNQKIHLKDCAAYGNQIVVRYDGKVGPCHAFSTTGEFFSGDILKKDFKIDEKIFNKWSKRSQLNNKQCEDCAGITLCGGGCAYNSYIIKKGDLNAIDDSICKHTKRLIGWVLEETWKK